VPITGAHILVADDSVEICTLMHLLLSSEGAEVESAHCADAARAQLHYRLPNLVIAETHLPGLPRSATVVDLLDGDEKWRDVPVLFCTVDADSMDWTTVRRRRPHTDVVFKPFDIDRLLTAAERLLDGEA
jgi:CheY-like chemotaxis protein